MFIVFLKSFLKRKIAPKAISQVISYTISHLLLVKVMKHFTTEDSQLSFNTREAVFPVAFKNSKKKLLGHYYVPNILTYYIKSETLRKVRKKKWLTICVQ